MGLLHSPLSPTNGLVLCLDSANRRSYPGSGNTWFDLSGNNNGILTNGPVLGTGLGGGIIFDGVNDFVDTIAGGNDLASNFTISFFYRPAVNNGDYRILFETDGYRQTTGGLAIYQVNNFLEIWRHTVGTGFALLIQTGVNTVGLNTWRHLTLTRAGSLLRLFLDATPSLTATTSQNFSTNNTKYNIGGGRSIYFFNGRMDDIRVYNRFLNQDEIVNIFNSKRMRFGL